MAIFLDTGKIKEIQKYHSMGIIRGVTTNPTILVKDGVTGGMEGVKKRSIEIAKLIPLTPRFSGGSDGNSPGVVFRRHHATTRFVYFIMTRSERNLESPGRWFLVQRRLHFYYILKMN